MRAVLARLVGASILLCSASCVRAGFGEHDAAVAVADGTAERAAPADRAVVADRADNVPDLPSPSAFATSANDTCSNPAAVDLAPLASGGQVVVSIDSSGAAADYASCATADVVLRLLNTPTTGLRYWCHGGGSLAYSGITSTSALACAQGTASAFGTRVCDGQESGGGSSSPAYLRICREPGKPALLVLSRLW